MLGRAYDCCFALEAMHMVFVIIHGTESSFFFFSRVTYVIIGLNYFNIKKYIQVIIVWINLW